MSAFRLDEKSKSVVTELFRYGFIGVAHNFSGYLVYLLITYIGVDPKLAMSVLYLVGATISFIGNKKWTFSHKGTVLSSGIRFIIAHCFGYLINLLLLIVFVEKLGYPHQWVQAMAIFMVAGFLFVSFKLFVFPRQGPLEE